MANDVEATIEDAVEKLDSGTKLLVRRELERLPAVIASGEEIIHMAHGRRNDGQGLIVTTDRRVMFIEDAIVKREIVELPYDAISAVEPDVNVVKSEITITGPDGKLVLYGIFPKDQTVELADDIRRRMGRTPFSQ
jgi:hypothetical protein